MLLNFNSSKERRVIEKENIVLVGDVGGTKTQLALFRVRGDDLTLLYEAKYLSQQYENLEDIIALFLKGLYSPVAACFGVAGPVLNNKVQFTNLKWTIDGEALSDDLGIKNIQLINDLEATAYGLALLNTKDVATIHRVDDSLEGNVAVIAPGTGLGEAGIYWDGKGYHPFATEGGHSDYAPRNQLDFELYKFLQQKFGHVSWERLICGPGIVNIYQFLRDVLKRPEPGWLKEKLKNADMATTISQQNNQSDICKETMQFFIRFLAYESANLVLKLNAKGGLFIGGGIAPHILPLFESHQFHFHFCQSGRLNYLLEKVPVKIILNTGAPLLGAAYYATHQITLG